MKLVTDVSHYKTPRTWFFAVSGVLSLMYRLFSQLIGSI